MALFGGFMGAVWLISQLFVRFFESFYAEKKIVDDLTIYSGELEEEDVDKINSTYYYQERKEIV
jgi:hypothetical protein